MISLSILVLTKNEVANIDRSVGAVFDQDVKLSFEVVVIDSGSSDGTLSKLQKYPVKLIEIPPEQFHHSRTRNLLAENSNGEVLIYLGGDAWPTSRNWLSNLIEPLSDPVVAAVYGRHLPKPGCSVERKIALAQMYGEERFEKHASNRVGQGFRFYHFSTVNCAIRREIWQRFKFPERQNVFEDLAMGKNILDAGLKIVYSPDAAVYHSHEHSAPKLFRRYFDTGVIWHQLGLTDRETVTSLKLAGIRGLIWKFRELRSAGCGAIDVARSATRDLVKGTGFFLGKHERVLPIVLKRRFSAFHLFG